VRTLVSRKTSGAAALLRDLVTKPEFEQREAGEQRTFLVAFAALADADAVPVLDRLLNGEPVKGNLLERLKRTVEAAGDPLTELRCAAAVALSSIGSATALAALDKGAGSRDKAVRDACMRSLRKLQP
jgi:AcrR family transcriptional regulator